MYIIRSKNSKYFYIGITNNIKRRIASHALAAKHKKSKLYNWINKYKDWELVIAYECINRKEANKEEAFWINFGRKNNWPLLNLANGGDGGYVIPDDKKEAWIAGLKRARAGRKPALGMKHTKENKEFFSKVSNEYWETHRKYEPETLITLSFKEAQKNFGISKTHYYRLKRALNNEQC